MKLINPFFVIILFLFLTISCRKDEELDQSTIPEDIVYVSGQHTYGASSAAVIWKNGVATNLTDGTNHARANSVFVSGKDVYAAGYEQIGTMLMPILWKNGQPTTLSDVGNPGTAHKVVVVGSDVYVVGHELNGTIQVGKVWKNGIASNYTDAVYYTILRSIKVIGNDVYVGEPAIRLQNLGLNIGKMG